MKKTIVSFNLLIVMVITINAQWTKLSCGKSNYLYSVYFTDVNTGYVVGNEGTILKTIDAGDTWADQSLSSPRYTLWSVHFIDSNTGYAVGAYDSLYYNGFYYPHWEILKTINGGTDWTKQIFEDIGSLNSVYFTDSNKGYVVGSWILNTENAGDDWTFQNIGISKILLSIYFFNINTGYTVGGDGLILKTINGGDNWTVQTSGVINQLNCVYFTDENTGFVVGHGGLILKTTNGGSDWIPHWIGTNNLFSVRFTDANTGYIVGEDGLILKTTNGGNDWIKQPSGTSNILFEVFFTDDNTGYVVGQGGTILKTANATGLRKGLAEEQIKIYPNPATDIITLKIHDRNTANLTLNIYNIAGVLVKSELVKGNQDQINISDLDNGNYMIEIKTNQWIKKQVLIIQK